MMQAYVFTVLLFTILPFYSFSFLFELLCERLHVERELGEARACGAFHGDNLVHVIVERLDEYTEPNMTQPHRAQSEENTQDIEDTVTEENRRAEAAQKRLGRG